MREPTDGEAIDDDLDADNDDGPLASLTGEPEGIGPRLDPNCPICTDGRGVPCAWHGT